MFAFDGRQKLYLYLCAIFLTALLIGVEEHIFLKEQREESLLDGVSSKAPALMEAHQLSTKAARVGFDWRDDAGALAKLDEEAAELRTAIVSGDRDAVSEEIGDTLFTVVMLSRRLGVDADGALARANAKFQERFARVELELRRRGVAVEDAGLTLMDRLWNEAKNMGPKADS
jgi:uncharacterized protein YabN with tetrapyrrole methylase and pyrophosphatase domain